VLLRLFDEVINGHNYSVIDDLFAPDYVNHGPFPANTPTTVRIARRLSGGFASLSAACQ
jgi:hypothetical protein